MPTPVEAAAQVMREAMREAVKKHSLWYLIQSVLMVLIGVFALIFPAVSSVAVVIFIGWLLILGGLAHGISLIDVRNVPHFWLQVLSAVLFVIVGVLFLRHPGAGLVSLTLLLIMFFMVEGFSKVFFSLTIRPFPNWGWILASGVLSILLSFFRWVNTPVTALWLLGVLLGIQLISEGLLLAVSPGRHVRVEDRRFVQGAASRRVCGG